MAISSEIPNKPQLSGISNKLPPATPEAPHAERAEEEGMAVYPGKNLDMERKIRESEDCVTGCCPT